MQALQNVTNEICPNKDCKCIGNFIWNYSTIIKISSSKEQIHSNVKNSTFFVSIKIKIQPPGNQPSSFKMAFASAIMLDGFFLLAVMSYKFPGKGK